MGSSSKVINHEMVFETLLTNYECSIGPTNLINELVVKTPKFRLNSTIVVTVYIRIRFKSYNRIILNFVYDSSSELNVARPQCIDLVIRDGSNVIYHYGGYPITMSTKNESEKWHECCYNNILKPWLKIECKIKHLCPALKKSTINTEIRATRNELYDRLKNMYVTKKFADVKINIDDEEFWAHKAILANNPVFAAMFTDEMMEKKENVIELKDIDPCVFTVLLKFLYFGDIEINLDEIAPATKLLLNLVVAADMYQIEDLKNIVSKLLIDCLNVENAVDWLLIADKYKLSVLRQESISFIDTHAKSVIETDSFSKMITSNVALATELLCFFKKSTETQPIQANKVISYI